MYLAKDKYTELTLILCVNWPGASFIFYHTAGVSLQTEAAAVGGNPPSQQVRYMMKRQ